MSTWIVATGLMFAGFLFSTSGQAYPLVPNPDLTQGDICDRTDPDFKENRYPERIEYCKRNVSNQLKSKIYDEYGISRECRSRFTIDHFIPLSIGGNNDKRNLWPEHKKVKATRPNFELDVFTQLSNGEITQDQALAMVSNVKTQPVIPHAITVSDINPMVLFERALSPCDQISSR